MKVYICISIYISIILTERFLDNLSILPLRLFGFPSLDNILLEFAEGPVDVFGPIQRPQYIPAVSFLGETQIQCRVWLVIGDYPGGNDSYARDDDSRVR